MRRQYEEALQVLQQAEQKFSGSIRVRQVRGMVLRRMGRVKDAQSRPAVLSKHSRHTATIGVSAAGQHRLQVGGVQQEMLNQLLVRVTGLEVGIGSAHGKISAFVLIPPRRTNFMPRRALWRRQRGETSIRKRPRRESKTEIILADISARLASVMAAIGAGYSFFSNTIKYGPANVPTAEHFCYCLLPLRYQFGVAV
jgi:hypothetical protein